MDLFSVQNSIFSGEKVDFFSCTSQHGAQVNSASRLGFEKKCDAEQVDLCVRPYGSFAIENDISRILGCQPVRKY